MSFIKVIAAGHLVEAAELRMGSNGRGFVASRIATARPYKSKDGERQSDFHNYIIGGAMAANFVKFVTKGSLVALEGTLENRKSEKDGKTYYNTVINVTSFNLLETKEQTDARKGVQPVAEKAPIAEETTNPMEISDDDLPF